MTIFACRLSVLGAMLADPVWHEKLDKVRTVAQLSDVVCEYAKEKGLTVKEITNAETSQVTA